MNVFRITIIFTEKDGFTKDSLFKVIEKGVNEIKLKLLFFDYQGDV